MSVFRGTSGRPSSDRLARAEATLRRINAQLAELERRQDHAERWQTEAQSHVEQAEATVTAPQPRKMTCAAGCGRYCNEYDHLLVPED